MLKGSTHKKALAKEQLLLAIGLQLFRKQGFASTTMRDIAAHAGVSIGLAYRYFASKDDFIFRLYAQVTGELDGLCADIKGAAPGTMLRKRLDLKCRILKPDLALYRELVPYMVAPDSALSIFGKQQERLRASNLEVIEDMIRRSNKTTALKLDPEDFSYLFYLIELLVTLVLFLAPPQSLVMKQVLDLVEQNVNRLKYLQALPVARRSLKQTAALFRSFIGQTHT